MIYLEKISSKRQMKQFYKVSELVYSGNHNARSTEEDVVKMIAERKSVFFDHASMELFLIKSHDKLVGRVGFIHDEKQPEFVQVAFFEAMWGLSGVKDIIVKKAGQLFPDCSKILVGLMGHLNYAAGFLASCFDQPPLFGLPYTPPWYIDYFSGLTEKFLVSYRFHNTAFYNVLDAGFLDVDMGDITIRHMDNKHLKRDVKIYTELNNLCFQDHVYWADRTWEEDFELFHPFRFLMKNENLIIAEDKGKPVGFLLWYPDFNQLTSKNDPLFLQHVLKYKLMNPINTTRLTEIAVLPEYRRKGIIQGLMKEFTILVRKGGYEYTEGGFIFEENKASINVTLKMIEKAYGKKIDPHRKYLIFEGDL
jgi:GNAT superfamily N-acetyltransferase